MSGLLKGKSGGGVTSILKHGLDLGEVGRVSDEVREFLAHGLLGQLVETVVLLPELFLNGHGGMLCERNFAEVERIEHTDSSLVPFVSLEMGELASLSQNEQAEGRVAGHADELSESSGVTGGNGSSIDSLSESQLEGVLTVVLPHALEMGLVGKLGGHLVGEDHILLLHDLGGKLAKSLVLSLESSLTFRGAGVKTEHDRLVLVGMGERVKHAISLSVAIVGEHVALLAFPGKLGDFVEEEAGAVATEPVLEAEPLEGVGFLTFSGERLRGPLGLEVVHGVVPGLTRVGIDVPAVLLLVLSPVGNSETLEDGTGASVEGDVSDTLEKGLGVEVLSVNMVHDVRLLVELVAIDVLHT